MQDAADGPDAVGGNERAIECDENRASARVSGGVLIFGRIFGIFSFRHGRDSQRSAGSSADQVRMCQRGERWISVLYSPPTSHANTMHSWRAPGQLPVAKGT